MTRAATLLATSVLAIAGCGGDDEDGSATEGRATTPAATATATEPETETSDATAEPPSEPGTAIRVGDSQYGEVLFDDGGQAVYVFDKETSSRPECYGDCAAAWPPVLTDGEPEAGDGAREGLLGTTERRDGETQVTYRGRPLYFYAHEGRDEVRCHNVPGFGGLWLALRADGTPPS